MKYSHVNLSAKLSSDNKNDSNNVFTSVKIWYKIYVRADNETCKGVPFMDDFTRKFNVIDKRTEIREILQSVYDSLKLKGYNPINQLVGYILSEDPTYITNYNNARSLITRLDRDELLTELVRNYLEKTE